MNVVDLTVTRGRPVVAFDQISPAVPSAFKEALRLVRMAYPNAILAGGALRDLQLGRPVKDLDFFVHDAVHDYETTSREARVLFDAGYSLARSVDLSSLGSDPSVVRSVTYDAPYTEALDGHDLPLNLIFLSTPHDVAQILARFDFGLCRIAYDGEHISVTRAFLEDVRARTLSLIRCDNEDQHRYSLERAERLLAKYPEFSLVDPFKDRYGLAVAPL